ncbi:MAG: hypothetical protein A2268_12120 [Candidatus Raymondbacteria bacterium RifOxyA12_full_50_37]|uniref:Uncharacterized protein n=1 Tax=Candidatus Raymondbacteria bacterium RIFOXYD12_FULL_49_13 TaxID=1817890 RepID=A0A1F7F2K1_UNCRA|nr:MAG: hypothetical protein A2268_12120 [Candidatus Raymondbacteria bacterium RifOxyA12_full_50_37]OGJ90291.1 MAG: hypothetical protein A2248_00005 [Candidatus Raymondbacteria bacterium RIFOXYA2_FULL_49_16]OGJ97281.1 MAG: hypothetical protein A2453_01465 [Candidatus Raymondbacteria bacterium RIFOXYC2_FULL_50_21]OGK00894.1 MAG: hypothetical protein A2519_12635 [Candidatus Raymondbacteria bacterium RIFOXYD12_FULL_49_13]OGK02505.1 MAG: hypothetical protein A2350_09910 [Candidatus Raymondbacteria 
MSKRNCWEVKKCGREPGGAREHDLGACPAAVNIYAEGINHGNKGGRSCWALAGTMCGGNIQGSFAIKYSDCSQCEFFNQVKAEEGVMYKTGENIKDIIKSRLVS